MSQVGAETAVVREQGGSAPDRLREKTEPTEDVECVSPRIVYLEDEPHILELVTFCVNHLCGFQIEGLTRIDNRQEVIQKWIETGTIPDLLIVDMKIYNERLGGLLFLETLVDALEIHRRSNGPKPIKVPRVLVLSATLQQADFLDMVSELKQRASIANTMMFSFKDKPINVDSFPLFIRDLILQEP